jgi:pimeloyl-ACP methyl ester carboxylesterase
LPTTAGSPRAATFALIHGAWHDHRCWHRLARLLRDAGHAVVAPDLPKADPEADLSDYARVVVEALGDADDVVVVGHSFGSDTAAHVAAARPVSLVVHLCPRLSVVRAPEDAPRVFRPGFRPSRLPGMTFWRPEDAIATMYRALDADTARAAAATLGPQVDVDGPRLSRLPDVPTEVVIARDDEVFTLDWSRWAARTLAGVEPIELYGGHFPMLERPDELADLLAGLRVRHAG